MHDAGLLFQDPPNKSTSFISNWLDYHISYIGYTYTRGRAHQGSATTEIIADRLTVGMCYTGNTKSATRSST